MPARALAPPWQPTQFFRKIGSTSFQTTFAPEAGAELAVEPGVVPAADPLVADDAAPGVVVLGGFEVCADVLDVSGALDLHPATKTAADTAAKKTFLIIA